MLDHVFTDAISALRDAFEAAFLERQAFEEHFQSDVLLGDLTWQTSYSLPGEGLPPRVRADISLDWPTWAQTAYRDWYIGDGFAEPPRIDIEITLRIQRLAESPAVEAVVGVLPAESSAIGAERLVRSGPTVETIFGHDISDPEYAIEISYEGTYDFDEDSLADGSALDGHFAAMGGWIASTLVKLGDVPLAFRPAEDLPLDGEG